QFKTNNGLSFVWHDSKNNNRIFDKGKADVLYQKLKGNTAHIQRVEKKQKKQFAPQLYDLTELQRDANRMFGFSGKQTLRAMQQLYERHKVLTYPRTDSRVFTTDIVPTLRDRIHACGVDEYAVYAKKLMNKKFQLPRSVVNDKEVSDHHAIIPTEEPVNVHDFGNNERKIYDLVIKRFLAVLSAPFEYEETHVTAEVQGEVFSTKEHTTIKLGWKEIYGEKQTKGAKDLQKGQTLQGTFQITEGETTPPERLTEGALLKAMENPTRYMEHAEKQVTKPLKEAGGIGTVATRADSIDKLINGQYMELRGKYIYLTQTGKQLLDLAPEDLRSPALTAAWEKKLLQIEKGQLKKGQFIQEIQTYTKEIVQQIKRMDATFK